MERFRPFDWARIRNVHPPGHIRTPGYCRGKVGLIVECLGVVPNPEALAYRRDPVPQVPLYIVRFRMADLWAQSRNAVDEVDIEILEHWLEPANKREYV